MMGNGGELAYELASGYLGGGPKPPIPANSALWAVELAVELAVSPHPKPVFGGDMAGIGGRVLPRFNHPTTPPTLPREGVF